MNESEIFLFTDGACRGNPGKGGWGVLLRYGQHEKRLWGGEAHTTNNRMELMAAIQGLEALKKKSFVCVVTDSQYVHKGVSEWMQQWKRRGWRTADKKPVKNQDLWERLDVLITQHDVRWEWVRGHAGHPENEEADRLANLGIDELQ